MVVMQPRYSAYQDDYDLRRENAIIIIQCQIRKFLAIRHVDRLRYKREMLRKLQEKYSAIKIQRFYRQQLNKRYENAAIMIQKHVRKLLAMKYVERIKEAQRRSSSPIESQKLREEEEKAAILLQSQIRKLLAIRRVDRMKALRQLQALERLQQNKENNEEGMEVGDEKLNELHDRLSETIPRTANNPETKKSHLKYDDYTAAVTIQRSWRGYNSRRRHSDVLEKLAKIRLNLKNEHHEVSIRQLIEIYLPLFYSNNLRKRQTAACFMNQLTENSQEFVNEFVESNGIPAVLFSSCVPTTTQSNTNLQKELVALLSKSLQSDSSEKHVNSNIESLLKFLVNNVKSQDRKLMLESCKCIYSLCQHPEAPRTLKELQFPFHVSQWRKQLVLENGQSGELQKAEETLRLINALPE